MLCVIFRRASHAGPLGPLCFALITSLHSPSVYKLSMIRFMHKVHIAVEFQLTHRLYAFFLRDSLNNFDTLMCLFDRFVNCYALCFFFT